MGVNWLFGVVEIAFVDVLRVWNEWLVVVDLDFVYAFGERGMSDWKFFDISENVGQCLEFAVFVCWCFGGFGRAMLFCQRLLVQELEGWFCISNWLEVCWHWILGCCYGVSVAVIYCFCLSCKKLSEHGQCVIFEV